jgi:insertion element IS1 protein InsB
VWLLYADCAETDETLAFAMGKRNSKTVRNLLLKLEGLEIDFFLTDDWEAFKAELPYYQHLIGKQFTKAIEGVNTWFRTRLRRLVRRTTCFSKRVLYIMPSLNLLSSNVMNVHHTFNNTTLLIITAAGT